MQNAVSSAIHLSLLISDLELQVFVCLIDMYGRQLSLEESNGFIVFEGSRTEYWFRIFHTKGSL